VAAKYFGQDVAVKQFKDDKAALLHAEAGTLFSFRHEYIVGVKGVCTNPVARDSAGKSVGLALVMQFAQLGSLVDLMRHEERRNELRSCGKWLRFLSQAAYGVFCLHSKSILHRDIKAGNVLVTDDLRPLVADFGLACGADGRVGQEGTYIYMAPELLNGESATYETDMYAFAMVMWFVACGTEVKGRSLEPWAGERLQDVIEMVLAEKRPQIPKRIVELKSLERFRLVSWDRNAQNRN
jgi:serine/threonine protein kinase